MEVLACLDGLVGVSDNPCPCFSDGRPATYNTSKSGRFLSDLLDMRMMGAAGDGCGEGGVWTLGAKALRRAALGLQTNLPQCWATRQTAKKRYIGNLSGIATTKPLDLPAGYAGIRIRPNANTPNGSMVLNGIGAVFNAAGSDSVTVQIWGIEGLLYSIPLDTAAGVLQQNTITPIVLPFSNGADPQDYFIVYPVGSVKPMNNEQICGCQSNLKRAVEAWAKVEGVTGADLADRAEWGCDGKLAYGLVPDVEFRCDVTKAICSGELDGTTDPNTGVISEYIMYAGAADMIGSVLRSPDPNVFTLHDGDTLNAMRQQYLAEANARMAGLCRSMDSGDCFDCKNKGGMSTIVF